MKKKRLLGYLISRVCQSGGKKVVFLLSFFLLRLFCLFCPSFRVPNLIHKKKLQEYKILSLLLSFLLSLSLSFTLSSIIHSSGDGDSDKISIGKTHARTHASTRARPHTHTHTPRDRHSCARTDTDRRIKMDR